MSESAEKTSRSLSVGTERGTERMVLSSRCLVAALLIGLLVPTSLAASSPGQDALNKGDVFYRQGRYQEAREAYKKATELNPGLLSAWRNLGWAYRKLDSADEAIRVWNIVLRVEPDDVDLLNELGMIHTERQDWAKAVESFEASLRLDSDQVVPRIRLGDAYEALQRTKDASESYDEVLRREPENLTVILRLVTVNERKGDLQAGMKVITQATERSPELLPELTPHYVRLKTREGDLAFEQGDWARASTSYEAALAWDPTSVPSLINLGWTQRNEGKNRKAIRAWTEALRVDPERGSLVKQIARAHHDLGEIDAARAGYLRARELDREDAEIPFLLADLEFQAGQKDQALEWLDALFAIPSADQDQSMKVAGLFTEHGYFEDGVAFFETRAQVVESPSTASSAAKRAQVRILSAHAETLKQAGETEAALSKYREAISVGEENSAAYRDFGWTLWRLDRRDETAEVWHDYAQAYPRRVEPLNLLTTLFLYENSFEEAIRTTRVSLSISPDQPDQALKLAKALFWSDQFRESKELAGRLAEEYPDHVPIQFFWGELLMQYHDFGPGKAQWRHVLDLGSDSERALYFWLKSRYEVGETRESVREARELLRNQRARQAMTRFIAEDALIQGDNSRAADWYKKLTELAPEQKTFWIRAGELYRESGAFDLAIETYEEAIRRFPDEPLFLLSRAAAYREAGDTDAALRESTRLEKIYPNNSEAYLNELLALIEAGHLEQALARLKQNRSTFLKDYEVALFRARILRDLNRLDEALEVYEQIAHEDAQQDHRTVDLPILLYHGLSTHTASMNMSQEVFESQIGALKRAGYTSINLLDLSEMLSGERPFPEKPIMITFDDARIDSFELGDPVLEKHGMKAIMFVPTGLIHQDHPFFADWDKIRFYLNTSRWRIESHGHLAHEEISLDREGRRVGFLVHPQWMKGEGRTETSKEYRSRIEEDHAASLRSMERETNNSSVLGYSFPFSEAGQKHLAAAKEAEQVNLEMLFKYFRFGFIQDLDGYNRLASPDSSRRLLRRFSVPRTWSGGRLVRYLARKNPVNVATIEIGESLEWSGEYARAEEVFGELGSRDALMTGEADYQLAAIALDRGHLYEAHTHLRSALLHDPEGAAEHAALRNRIEWAVRPLVGYQFQFFYDSDERRNWSNLLVGEFSPFLPSNFERAYASVGLVEFDEDGFDDVSGEEFSIGSAVRLFRDFSLTGALRQRFLSRADDSTNGWVQVGYGVDNQRASLRWSYEDVETVGALQSDVQVRTYGGAYQLRFARWWRFLTDLSYWSYEDTNERYNATANLTFELPWWSGWTAGAVYRYANTDDQTNLYYTPADLNLGLGTLAYRQEVDEKWIFEIDGGVGGGHDSEKGGRVVGTGGAEITRMWLANFRSSVRADFLSNPDYQAVTVQFRTEYRF